MKFSLNSFHLIGILAMLLILGSCKSRPGTSRSPKDPLDLSALDTGIRPQDNFFLYANGTWIKRTKIPASEPAWGGMMKLQSRNLHRVDSLLDSLSRDTHLVAGSFAQKTGNLFYSGMDSARLEQLQLKPLQPLLARIDSISNIRGLLSDFASEYSIGLGPVFSFYAAPDDKNSQVNRAHFDQGGLGLPNRDYYFKQDSATKAIRKAYLNEMAWTFQALGHPAGESQNMAGKVLDLETHLASFSKSPVHLRNPLKNYHKLAVSNLSRTDPGLQWPFLLHSLGVQQDSLLVGQPEFYQGLSGLLGSQPLGAWKDYLQFHLVNDFSPYLSHRFVDASFTYERLLTGQKSQTPRWKRMSEMVDQELGDALGKLYVQRYFPPEVKARMVRMVSNLIQAYAARIRNLSWMSDSTKVKALAKLHAMVRKIAYPDKWKKYASVTISRDDLVGNIIQCGRFAYQWNIRKIGKPVDRYEWYMTPVTADAYYNATTNDINFPAGFLQPPFFFMDADDAVNYGGIGWVIGHEITHGFDDQGRRYDAQGNLKNWWTPGDSARFAREANLAVEQYDHYTVLDSLHINGKLTLGENLADIGGIAISFAAFEKTPEALAGKKIDGFTPEQRFFLSVAQVARLKYRDASLRTMLRNNPHSPFMFRVNGPLSDLRGFYKAFGVNPGDGMYRPDSTRVRIW